MRSDLTRRTFLGQLGNGIAAAALLGSFPRKAFAAETLTVAQWGGPWVEAANEILAKQQRFDVKWQLYAGGAGEILPKIKAAWPNPSFDAVNTWDPIFYAMIREGWLETLTPNELPNLADISEDLLFKDSAGNNVVAPMNVAAVLWGYRNDKVPFPIKKIEDLIDPRLKGQICYRDAVQGSNNMTVSLALEFGGDEKNLEPGWKFLKELAKAGNIGRVAHTEVDFINSLTTGETSVGFWNIGGWNKVAKYFPCTFLTKVPGSRGMKTFITVEGFVVLKNSPKKQAAKEFVNYLISPENNELYCSRLSMVPTNSKAKVSKAAEAIFFPLREDREKYIYHFDYDVLSRKSAEMVKRFETEITPLL